MDLDDVAAALLDDTPILQTAASQNDSLLLSPGTPRSFAPGAAPESFPLTAQLESVTSSQDGQGLRRTQTRTLNCTPRPRVVALGSCCCPTDHQHIPLCHSDWRGPPRRPQLPVDQWPVLGSTPRVARPSSLSGGRRSGDLRIERPACAEARA